MPTATKTPLDKGAGRRQRLRVLGAATVGAVESLIPPVAAPTSLPEAGDAESQEWLRCLRVEDTRDDAIARLHALLLRAARFEVARRGASFPHLRGNELDDIANEAADDALMSVLRRLDDFRGASRFTTWVYKFALLEAAAKVRKRAWQGREVPLEPETWGLLSSTGLEPDAEAEQHELLATLQSAIADVLTPHQRSVLVALALNGVPIDVLAERLSTNRGALYKTLHDARRKLRKHLEERGLALDDWSEDR
jgi:RNA polymerase sigma-70 factor (ECF subfamily)